MLKAVIFDFDGVIVDSEECHYHSIMEALHPHHIPLTFPKFKATYTGNSDRSVIIRICQDYNVPFDGPQVDTWRARKVEIYGTAAPRMIKPLPGAVGLIDSVAAHLPIGLATGSRRPDVETILGFLEGGRLRSLFQTTVSCDDVTSPKPHPETYASTLRRMGIDPEHAIAIEDTPGGTASAKGAGLRVLAVTGTFGREKLGQADRIIDTLEGLSIAHLKEWFG